MGKTAFLFPGQGAQAVGMGKALADLGGTVGDLFNEADDVLGYKLSDLMFNGPEADLTLTENTQPALVTVAMAAYQHLISETDLRPDYVAGHSLGEYAAICAAGGFSFADAVRLVNLRGKAMQAAVPVGVGSMAAMLNMAVDKVESVCQQASEETGKICVPANYNTAAQIVISGHKDAVEKAVALAKEQGAKRCVILAVSAPFHCPLMQPAAEKMAEALAATEITDLTTPLIANVTADSVTEGSQIRDLLVKQVTGAVRWEASIKQLQALGVDTFVEVGSGKVLTGMMRRIDRKANALFVNTPDDVQKLKNA
ncbi:MAG: ACP S-malonyltransferase [Magnetococcales bacterium]|nr:ACP S-malonyltransferase [Magnetococcales bacterium]